MPTDLHGRPIGGDGHAAVERTAGATIDAMLIVRCAYLVLHYRKGIGKGNLNQRSRGLLAGVGEVAVDAVGSRAGMQFDMRRTRHLKASWAEPIKCAGLMLTAQKSTTANLRRCIIRNLVPGQQAARFKP